ncbi:MAG: lipopolysaccharide biosynthesis protein [Magnetospiraceae bacterium]
MPTLRKSLAWSFGQQGGRYVIQFVGAIFIARLLTPEEMGIFALAMAANGVLSALRGMGVGRYLIREPDLTDDKIASAFAIILLVGIALGVILLGVAGPVSALYGEPRLASVLYIVSIGYFLSPIGQPAMALMQRNMRFDQLAYINLASGLVGTSTNIICAYLGYGVHSLAMGLVLGNIVQYLGTLAHYPNHIKMMPNLRHWREVVSFGGLATLANLIGTLNSDFMKFVTGGILGPAALGQIDRAGNLPNMTRRMLFLPMSRVLFPHFAKMIRDKAPLNPAVLGVVGGTSIIIVPAFFTMALVSGPVVRLLFGDQWGIAGEIMPFLLAGSALLTLQPQPDALLTADGRLGRLVALRLILLVSSLLFTVFGALGGIMTFAYSRVPAALFAIIAIYIAIRPVCAPPFKDYLRLYLKAMAVIAITCPPAVICHLYWGEEAGIIELAGVAISATLLWLAAIFIVNHPLKKEVTMILTRLTRRGD